MARTRKPKREFSKIILFVVSIFTFGITVFSCVMIWKTGDLSPLAYLIPSVFTELATATGFYYRKAQRENELKIPHYLSAQNMTDNEASVDENT